MGADRIHINQLTKEVHINGTKINDVAKNGIDIHGLSDPCDLYSLTLKILGPELTIAEE